MTIAELITAFQQYPQDMRVVVLGYEDGVDDVLSLSPTPIVRDVSDSPLRGQHDICEEDEADETALCLS